MIGPVLAQAVLRLQVVRATRRHLSCQQLTHRSSAGVSACPGSLHNSRISSASLRHSPTDSAHTKSMATCTQGQKRDCALRWLCPCLKLTAPQHASSWGRALLEQATRLHHRRCTEQGTRWFATAQVQGGGGRGERTLMQGRRLRTWWGHPAGMNTASPGYCSNCQGLTPYSAFSAARCLAVSMNVCV